MTTTRPHCALCNGQGHIRTARGMQRCACILKILEHGFIKPVIRGDHASYPLVWNTRDPLPLGHVIVTGSYTDFRFYLWRSLVTYPDLIYDYLYASRLVDIEFERDPTYARVWELLDPAVLVLVVGVADPPNTRLKDLLSQLLVIRGDVGKPLWVYHTGDLLYGPLIEARLPSAVRIALGGAPPVLLSSSPSQPSAPGDDTPARRPTSALDAGY